VRARNRAGTASAKVRWTVVSPSAAAVTVPILLYHVIAAPSPATPNPSLWVDPSEFSAELAWLAANGYTAVTLDQWWQAWHGGAPLQSGIGNISQPNTTAPTTKPPKRTAPKRIC